jgi:hypothetical protein
MADSLLDDLDNAVDKAISHHPRHEDHAIVPLPYIGALGAIRQSSQLLGDAQASIANATTKALDYDSFVRFLADTPVPAVSNVEKYNFLGSGWTMSVWQGRANLNAAAKAVAVK